MATAESLGILIVDDNESNLLSLHSLIDQYIADVNVLEASSGIVALNILMKHRVDLIILDIQMPEMDGFETARLIHSRKKSQHIPIVFLTAAYKSEEFKKRGYAIGAADYLTKPIDAPQLISKIKTYLHFIQQEHQRITELSEMNQLLKREIVERQQAEEALKQAKEIAEAANLAKSRFLANMSHELRTPLNAIIGYSEILKEDALEKGYNDLIPDLEHILTSGEHLLNLINDLLDISKIESGKMELHPEAFNLPNVIHQIVHTVRHLMEKGDNILEVYCAHDIPQTIYADLTKVRQILLNLLDNAAKFTEKGHVRLEITGTTESGKAWLDFRVTDDGIGLTTEQISKLFKLFTQIDASSTRKYGGTGLGLTISKRFAEMMGGSIAVQSQYGQGSTFLVRLPLVESSEKERRNVEKVVPISSHPLTEALLSSKYLAVS